MIINDQCSPEKLVLQKLRCDLYTIVILYANNTCQNMSGILVYKVNMSYSSGGLVCHADFTSFPMLFGWISHWPTEAPKDVGTF